MTDLEIKNYLELHSFEVNSQDVTYDILNTSDQILAIEYDSELGTMTLFTKDNTFKFKLKIKSL